MFPVKKMGVIFVLSELLIIKSHWSKMQADKLGTSQNSHNNFTSYED